MTSFMGFLATMACFLGIAWTANLDDCRVCLSNDAETNCGMLVFPCACKGTNGPIHEECLRKQFVLDPNWQKMICPTCKTPYTAMHAVDLGKYKLQLQTENPHPDPSYIWLNLHLISEAYNRAGNLYKTIEWEERALKYAMKQNRFSFPRLHKILHLSFRKMQGFYKEARIQRHGVLLKIILCFAQKFPEKSQTTLELALGLAFHMCGMRTYEKEAYTVGILFSIMKAHINAVDPTAYIMLHHATQKALSMDYQYYSDTIPFQQLGKFAAKLARLHIKKGCLDYALKILRDISQMNHKPMKETFHLSLGLGKIYFDLKKYKDQVQALKTAYDISKVGTVETPLKVDVLLLMSLGLYAYGADFDTYDKFYQGARKLREESRDEYDLESKFQWFSKKQDQLILEKRNGL